MLAARRRVEAVNLFVHSGTGAWERAGAHGSGRNVGHRLLLPHGRPFTAFDWTAGVRDLEVVVIYRGDPAYAIELSRHLVRRGAALAVVLRPKHQGGSVYLHSTLL